MVRAKRIKSDSMRNGKKPGSLLDHSDTDSEVEFALPPRKFTKPGKSFVKRRGCSNCWKTCTTVLLVLLLVASVLSIVGLIWFSLRLKNDIDYLRKRVGYAESNSRSNSQEYKVFEKELENKIQEAKVGEHEIKVLQNQFKSVVNQIGYLNKTIALVQQTFKLPDNMVQLASDIVELKKGMADSGAVNVKVTSEVDKIKTAIQDHDQAIRLMNVIIKNITEGLAEISGKPVLQAQTALPTLPSSIQEKDNINQPEKSSSVDDMTQHFTQEIDRVMEVIGHVNESLVTSVSEVKNDLQAAKNTLDELKSQQVTPPPSNSSEPSVSSSDLESIRNKLESISTSMNHGLQKHNDSIISLANSLSELRVTTAHTHDDITSELMKLKQMADNSNNTDQLQVAVQTNTEHINQIEEDLKTLNSHVTENSKDETTPTTSSSEKAQDNSSAVTETATEAAVQETAENNSSSVTETATEAVTEAAVQDTSANSTTVNSTTVNSTTVTEPEAGVATTAEPQTKTTSPTVKEGLTPQNETEAASATTSESAVDNTTVTTVSSNSSSTAEAEEDALESTKTADESETAGDNQNTSQTTDGGATDTKSEDDPTRVTRAIPNSDDDKEKELNDLIQ